MSEHKLLSPCPFCGEKLFLDIDDGGGVAILHSLKEKDCFFPSILEIEMPVGTTLEQMIEKINHRPIQESFEHALVGASLVAAARLQDKVFEIQDLKDDLARRDEELKITDGLLKEATETIGAVVACCTYNDNEDAKIGIYGIDQKAFTKIDRFMTHYNDAVSAGKVSVDVKTSTDNNKRSKWKAYVPGWGAPTVNKRYLVKLINDWIAIATYYLRVGGGYWKDDRGQELADGVVSLWKELEE